MAETETVETSAPADGQAQGWLDSFEGDARGFVENKGWKNPADMLASYQGLEKVRGVPEDRLLTLPNDPSADGAMDGVWSKLGRPESADKYTKAVGEEFQDDVFKAISETAFKAGVTDNQFKALQENMTQISASVVEAQETAAAEAFDTWKSQNAEGFNTAARVMATVGVNDEQLAGILAGDKASLYDFLAKVGARSQEGKVVEGDPPAQKFDMSPEAAKTKIAEKLGDKDFMDRYTNRSKDVRDAAIAEMEALQKIATGGKK